MCVLFFLVGVSCGKSIPARRFELLPLGLKGVMAWTSACLCCDGFWRALSLTINYYYGVTRSSVG